jgi:poly-gamma-glutamate synthesis protein (capsule biosynthesis protein)
MPHHTHKAAQACYLALAAILSLAGALCACSGRQSSVQSGATTFSAAAQTGQGQAQDADNDAADVGQGDASSQPESALLSFAGDCTFSSVQGSTRFNDVYDANGSAYFLSGVQSVFANDDLTVVNLEGTFTENTQKADKGSGTAFWFRAPPSYVDILTNGSVEACDVANNHSHDYGTQGLEDTISTLDGAGIGHFGYDDVYTREVNGITFGFFGLAFDDSASDIHAAMDKLKAQGAEVIIGWFHDGIEGTYTPSESQVTAAHTAIDYGALAVMISHPHRVQGIETYHGGLIAYSLGNFCFGGNDNPSDMDSMIMQMRVSRANGGFTYTYKVIPCSISAHSGYNDFCPQVLSGSDAASVLGKIEQRSQALGTDTSSWG